MVPQPKDLPGLVRAADLVRMLDDPAGPVRRALADLYPAGADLDAVAGLCREAAEAFCRDFGGDRRVFVARSTGRINLMGMHIDHRGGFVNPIAIRELFLVVEPRRDDEVRLCNADPEFPPCRFRISEGLPRAKIRDWDAWTHEEFDRRRRRGEEGHWSNYVRAAVLYLQHERTRDDGAFDPPLRGMNVAVKGNVPRAAGLSSSSALVVGAMEACAHVNALGLEPLEMVQACWTAEWYVGTRGGGGDHAAIKFGRKGHVLHIGAFPLSVDWMPFPEGYSVVLANSLVEARKQEGARDVFNRLVAAYVFGLLMLRRNHPRLAPKMRHLRDVNPHALGLSEADIYRMLLTLPERAHRSDILAALPDDADEIERTFRSHAEPPEGYPVRGVTAYGITECLRSAMAPGLLAQGRVEAFGELIRISHDGDRVTREVDGRRVPVENRLTDEHLHALIADAESGDPVRVERARLWRQPGGYNASSPEQDLLTDIALSTPGVVGAGLVGAGLGGSIIALVERERAGAVIEAMAERYYRPRALPVAAEVVEPVGGSGILDITGAR